MAGRMISALSWVQSRTSDALAQDLGPRAALICNGVKDAEFVRLALMSQRLGFNVFLVLESRARLSLFTRG